MDGQSLNCELSSLNQEWPDAAHYAKEQPSGQFDGSTNTRERLREDVGANLAGVYCGRRLSIPR